MRTYAEIYWGPLGESQLEYRTIAGNASSYFFFSVSFFLDIFISQKKIPFNCFNLLKQLRAAALGAGPATMLFFSPPPAS